MHRLFVALRPPAHIRDRLIDVMEGVDGARWQDEDQLHLTLRYIGEVERSLANDLAEALQDIAMPPFEVALRGTGIFSRKGRAHTLWAGVAPQPELARLQRKVERRCQLVGIEPEHRKFMPHVTIARLNAASGPVDAFLAEHAVTRFGNWQAENFGLFESHLRTGGSLYREVVDYPLFPAEQPVQERASRGPVR